MKHIGFTGTRHGMTPEQKDEIGGIVSRLDACTSDVLVGHHGDCVGADAEFHAICERFDLYTIGHIPVDSSHRANCLFHEVREPLTHMKRNRAIVSEADVMIAAPYEETEQERGGTWATIRMARKAYKPLAVVYPNGSVLFERWPALIVGVR